MANVSAWDGVMLPALTVVSAPVAEDVWSKARVPVLELTSQMATFAPEDPDIVTVTESAAAEVASVLWAHSTPISV
jgi:hypothetical protein